MPTNTELARFRNALRRAPVVLFAQDLHLRYLWVHNPSYAFGNDVVGLTDAELFPPATAAVLTDIKSAVIASGDSVRREVRLELPAGVTYYDLIVEPTRDANDQLTGVAGVALDISDRVQSEIARIDGAERLRLAQNAAGIGIYEYDLRTGVVQWDERVRTWWGVSTDEPATFADFLSGIHPDDQPSLEAAVGRALQAASDGHFQLECRVISRNDGVERWMASTGTIVSDGRRPIRLIGTLQDITARKHDEVALRANEEWLRLAADAAGTGLWTWDMASDAVTWSEEAYRIHGLRDHEFGGTADHFFQLVHPDDVQRVRTALLGALEQRTRYSCEFRIVRPDGTVRWVANLGRGVYDAGGRPLLVTGTITDVTDRKHAEQRVHTNERRLRAVLDQTLAGIAETDLTGRFVRVNPRYCEIVGRTADELTEMTMQEITHPEDLTLNLALFEKAASDGTPFVMEKRYVRPGGEVVWVNNSVSLMRDENGAASGIVAAVLDVTANKRAEVALRDSEAHFRSMADNAPTMLWVTDPAGQCTYLSRRWYEFTGTTAAEGLGLGWLECIHPADRRLAGDTFLDANRRRVGFTLDYRVRQHDGEYRWAVDAGQPRFGAGGEFLGFVGSVTDVHERVLAEQAVRASEERFRLAADAVNGIIYEYDLLTHRVERTRGLAEVLGYSPDEVPPTDAWWMEQIHPDDRPAIASGVGTVMMNRYTTGYRVRHKDGRWLHVVDRAVVLRDDSGEPVRIIGCTVDVTDQMLAEATLRDADRKKDEFLATLAHELRNPLAPVRNAVQVLLGRGPADAESLWACELIDRQVRIMARLLDDLLDVSRITRDRMELRKERVVLSSIVTAAVETSRPLIDAAGHSLTIDVPDEPLVLDADPVRLAQIFGNLLNNAAKYTDRGGRLRFTAERAGEWIAVSVADNGIGIAPDLMPRLFEMFAQGEPALHRARGGVGIGLKLVRGLAELHGGTVTAHSEGPGRGSTFTVRLPLNGAIATAPVTAEAPRGAVAKYRLLVADDLADNADSLARLLTQKGHEVRTVYDGDRAVDVAGQFRPDAVLLDLGMPGVNGFDVCRRIRAHSWGRQICLVAVTGWGQDVDRQRTAAAGFDHHIVKPIDPDQLLHILQEWLGSPSS